MLRSIFIPIVISGCVVTLSPHENCLSAGYAEGTESFAHCVALEGGSLEEITQSLPPETMVSQNSETEITQREIDPKSFCKSNGFVEGSAYYNQCIAVAEGRNQYVTEDFLEDDSGRLLSKDTEIDGE